MRIFPKLKQPTPKRIEPNLSFHGITMAVPGKNFLTLETKIILLVWVVVASSLFTTYTDSSKVYEIVEEVMGKNATRIAQSGCAIASNQ